MTMVKGALISKDEVYRYQLWRVWNPDKPFMLFIGLNPSTADAERDDPTIARLSSFAWIWGYGGIYVGNLFAFRATDPKKLYKVAEPEGPENWNNVQEMRQVCDKVVFMWGARGGLRNQADYYIKAFPNAYCFKKSDKGFPYHPLYLPYTTELIKF